MNKATGIKKKKGRKFDKTQRLPQEKQAKPQNFKTVELPVELPRPEARKNGKVSSE